jgi:hypothetical protein
LVSIFAALFPAGVRDLQLEAIDHVRRTSLETRDHHGPQTWEQYDSFLRVDFSTSIDLAASAENSSLNLWLAASYCPMSDPLDSRRDIQWAGPYFQDVGLPIWEAGEEERYKTLAALHPADRRHVYNAYLIPKMPERADIRYGKPRLPAYDLSAPLADVCLLVGGGNMLGGILKSNVITIPRGALVEALRKPAR